MPLALYSAWNEHSLSLSTRSERSLKRKSQVTWRTVTKVSSNYLILMIWSSSFSDDNKHICKMFAIVMLWGSRFGQMRMFSYFMMTIFDNTFWWQFSDFLKFFWFFEILWHFTLEALITCDTWYTDYTDFLKSCDTWDTAYMWHLRHWLHCWQLRTTLLRITLWSWIACDRDSILNSWDVYV